MEQHYMTVYGGKAVLENQRNAISEKTYYRLKSTLELNPCG
jgi:hypothetical protein